MDLSRRQFMRIGAAVPAVSMMASRGLSFVPYSAGSKVGPWVGWVEGAAGNLIAFVSRTGRIIGVK